MNICEKYSLICKAKKIRGQEKKNDMISTIALLENKILERQSFKDNIGLEKKHIPQL